MNPFGRKAQKTSFHLYFPPAKEREELQDFFLSLGTVVSAHNPTIGKWKQGGQGIKVNLSYIMSLGRA